jgi:hypothetical protein
LSRPGKLGEAATSVSAPRCIAQIQPLAKRWQQFAGQQVTQGANDRGSGQPQSVFLIIPAAQLSDRAGVTSIADKTAT